MDTITTTNFATTTEVYELISLTQAEALYISRNATRSEPKTIRVSSSYSAATDSDRVLVEISLTDRDVDDNAVVGKAHIVLTLPRKTITEATLKEVVFELTNLVRTKYADLYAGLQPND